MADSSDVETAIGTMLGAAFYPTGDTNPSTIGTTVRIQRGWPTEAQVQNAVKASVVLISVYGDKGMSRDVTRYFRDFHACAATPTITATISGLIVTFAGTPSVGNAVAVQNGGVWWPYIVQASDTLTSIAAALAALIPGATSSGAVLTLPAARGPDPQVRVVMASAASAQVAQQQMQFRISVWAPTPELRDAVFSAPGQLPAMIAYLGSRLTLPDGTTATWMGQRESGPDDLPGRANEWRRDVLVNYEFAVVYTVAAMALLLLEVAVTVNCNTIFIAGDAANPTDAMTDGSGNPVVDLAGDLLGSF